MDVESFDGSYEGWRELAHILYNVYRLVVRPFETEFKQLMEQLQIANEGELFCTEMQFNYCSDGKNMRIVNEQGVARSDQAERVERKVKDIIKRHK